jgi:hypothetical protein
VIVGLRDFSGGGILELSDFSGRVNDPRDNVSV